jgi:hypothetical protein
MRLPVERTKTSSRPGPQDTAPGWAVTRPGPCARTPTRCSHPRSVGRAGSLQRRRRHRRGRQTRRLRRGRSTECRPATWCASSRRSCRPEQVMCRPAGEDVHRAGVPAYRGGVGGYRTAHKAPARPSAARVGNVEDHSVRPIPGNEVDVAVTRRRGVRRAGDHTRNGLPCSPAHARMPRGVVDLPVGERREDLHLAGARGGGGGVRCDRAQVVIGRPAARAGGVAPVMEVLAAAVIGGAASGAAGSAPAPTRAAPSAQPRRVGMADRGSRRRRMMSSTGPETMDTGPDGCAAGLPGISALNVPQLRHDPPSSGRVSREVPGMPCPAFSGPEALRVVCKVRRLRDVEQPGVAAWTVGPQHLDAGLPGPLDRRWSGSRRAASRRRAASGSRRAPRPRGGASSVAASSSCLAARPDSRVRPR